MAIERAVLPERVRVNILSSEGARATQRATLCGARTSELYQAPRNLSIASEVAVARKGWRSRRQAGRRHAAGRQPDKTNRVVARGRCQSKGKGLLSPGLISPIELAKGVCKDLDAEYDARVTPYSRSAAWIRNRLCLELLVVWRVQRVIGDANVEPVVCVIV
jgi:hypothetical protein